MYATRSVLLCAVVTTLGVSACTESMHSERDLPKRLPLLSEWSIEPVPSVPPGNFSSIEMLKYVDDVLWVKAEGPYIPGCGAGNSGSISTEDCSGCPAPLSGEISGVDTLVHIPRGEYIEIVANASGAIQKRLSERIDDSVYTHKVSGLSLVSGNGVWAIVRRTCRAFDEGSMESFTVGSSDLQPMLSFGFPERTAPAFCCHYKEGEKVPLTFAAWNTQSGDSVVLVVISAFGSAGIRTLSLDVGNSAPLYQISGLKKGAYTALLSLKSNPLILDVTSFRVE